MKRLAIAMMCLLMCFSTVMPTAALAKCAHKKTQWQTTQRATCCNTGVKKLICKNCGKVLNRKTLPKVSHQFKTFRTWKPSCTDVGYKMQLCSVYGDMRTVKYGKVLGHKWSSWKKNFLTGKYTRHCTRSGCDATQHKK